MAPVWKIGIRLKKPLNLMATGVLAGLLMLVSVGGCSSEEKTAVGMAVEFNDHAACAYISQNNGWFAEEGLEFTAYESYVTGMALAAALARGDIEVAYICLVPAITAYANGGVPIRIVAGTHKFGYGLVANPEKIATVMDLARDGIRLGCVREGSAADIFFRKTISRYNLDEDKVLSNTQRMSPPNQILAIESGKLDAAFLPEQWATMAEELGFNMLVTSQEVWPDMPGSVLIVKNDLIKKNPEVVRRLVKVSQKATDWVNQHRGEAAEVMAQQLGGVAQDTVPSEVADVAAKLKITPAVLLRSMNRMQYTTAIEPETVQATIDYLAELGYIKGSFDAEDILDLRFLESE
jgi:NitT/TauT family transport system substrate-binding protein